MHSILSELWNGEIAPCEHCGARDGKANTLFTGMRQKREVLEAELTERQKADLDRYFQLSEDYLLRMMELAFREGIILGARLGSAVFSEGG